MPRKGKGNARGDTPNSADGGAVIAAPKIDGPQDAHGERGALNELQAAVPPGRPAPPQAGPAPGAPPGAPGGGIEAAMQLAQTQMPQRGPSLGEVSGRPGEPITTGAPIGAGAGPTRAQGRTALVLGRIAAMTDDPALIQIAQRASRKGL
jgi:hypothetical protein